MNIQEFIAQCEGNWFAQRTDYSIAQDKFANNQTLLSINVFSSEHPELQKLCQKHHISGSIIGMETSWAESGQKLPKSSTIVVFTADNPTHHQGNLVQIPKTDSPINGRYCLGDDEALTLTLTEGATSYTERLWFASPNLRLRTSLFMCEDGVSTTSFYSEIRKLPPKPAPG
ncbi:MAG: phycobiliprotein lyase [Cyanophyceae cyanobacterium]